MKAKILYAISLLEQAQDQLDDDFKDEYEAIERIIVELKKKNRPMGIMSIAHTFKELYGKLGEKL